MTKIKKISAIMVAAVILCTCFLISGCGGNTRAVLLKKQLLQFQTKKQHPQAQTQPTQSTTATIDVKDYGKIEVELYERLARLQSKNFVDLCKKTAFMTVLLSTESLPAL